VLSDTTLSIPGRQLLGRGWRFPVVPDGLGRLGWSQAEESIEEAIWIILSTAPGERVMLPEFGCGELAATLVRQALVRWEPRVDVLDVDATTDDGAPNLVLIRITYRVRKTNAVNNLVYPFSLTEAT
jgi:phage baseplate assembly protein W